VAGAEARTAARDASGRSFRPGSLVLAAVGLASVAAFVVVALQRLSYPYELTYFEGSTVEVTARVVAGQPLYGPPTTAFVSWPYPPLYFWVTGALARLTGLDLPTMRLVSFAASLAVLVLLAMVVRRTGGSIGTMRLNLFMGGPPFDNLQVRQAVAGRHQGRGVGPAVLVIGDDLAQPADAAG